MLKATVASPLQVSAFSTWEKELHKVVFDPRYLLLNSEERKQVPVARPGDRTWGHDFGKTHLGARLADRCRRPGRCGWVLQPGRLWPAHGGCGGRVSCHRLDELALDDRVREMKVCYTNREMGEDTGNSVPK